MADFYNQVGESGRAKGAERAAKVIRGFQTKLTSKEDAIKLQGVDDFYQLKL